MIAPSPHAVVTRSEYCIATFTVTDTSYHGVVYKVCSIVFISRLALNVERGFGYSYPLSRYLQ